MAKAENKIYTHNEATDILEIFEDVLADYNIIVPSPEDDDREEDNEACLYGSTYSDLLDAVEERLIDILNRKNAETEVVSYVFS